jgi:hypothetical protein
MSGSAISEYWNDWDFKARNGKPFTFLKVNGERDQDTEDNQSVEEDKGLEEDQGLKKDQGRGDSGSDDDGEPQTEDMTTPPPSYHH